MQKYFKSNRKSGIDISTSLLIGAIHRVCDGRGSKRSFSEFANETTLPEIANFKAGKLTSQHFWAQMDKVELKEIEAFQKEFTKKLHLDKIIDFEKLSFDTTNFFTYIDSGNNRNKLALRGHNKQKRNDLRQFSLGLLVSKNFLIPLSTYVYEGNITDQKLLSPYIKSFKSNINTIAEADKITVIFDKGGCSKGNLKDIEEEGFHYICAFSLSHKKKLAEIPLADYEIKKVKGKDILLLREEEEIWDKKRTVLLYYSSKLHEGQIRGLNKSIAAKKEKLLSLQETLKNPRTGIKTRAQLQKKLSEIINGEHGTKLFKIKIKRKKPLCFEFSFDKSHYDYITGEIFGKKALITDRSDWNTEEILSSYFSQSEIEKVFRHVKNPDHHSIRPQFHWTDQKIHVHVFICLLGFMLTCLLQKELQEQSFIAEKEKIIDTLMKVRQFNVFRLGNNKKSKTVDTRLEEMDEYTAKCYNALLKVVGK
ncbi:MAG: IS1634 family transposase [Candidatus Margulisbacteria bacterium]|nr:IS1634 family transposase [Candidatus Margulisiibacteriota bacterium]